MKNIIIEIKTLMDGVTRKLDTVRNNGDDAMALSWI